MSNNTACPRCGGKSTYAGSWRGVYCQVQCSICGWRHIVESWAARVDLGNVDGGTGLNDIDPNDPCYGADPS